MSRNEDILQSIINGESLENYTPQSRMEALLLALGNKIESGGSGSGNEFGKNLVFEYTEDGTIPKGEVLTTLEFKNDTAEGWTAIANIPYDVAPCLVYMGNGLSTNFIVPIIAIEITLSGTTVKQPYISFETATVDGTLYLSAFNDGENDRIKMQIINAEGEDVTNVVINGYKKMYAIKL